MFKVGDQFKQEFSYTQEEVDMYAKVSGDTNPLHIDEAAGKNSMFGRRIIHGFLGASIFTRIFGTLWYAEGTVYMAQSVKWMRPMFTEQQYVGVITVKEINAEKHRVTYVCEVFDVATGEQTIAGEATLMNKKQYVWE
ncbi:MAG: MaoC family dehydratase [Sphingobacteriales bacterium]|nr:MAG: MaoC family dehydratase [Sphingobacteriales bacterium]